MNGIRTEPARSSAAAKSAPPSSAPSTAAHSTHTGEDAVDIQHVIDIGLGGSRLSISQPADRNEIAADQMADRVLREPTAPCCSACAADQPCEGGEDKPTLARKAIPGRRVTDTFLGPLGGGRPLDAGARAFFEPRFDRDLSAVRLHTGPAAQRASSAVGALAFTVGTDIAVGATAPALGSIAGERLLAHELAHVVQQSHQPPAIHRVGAEDPPFGYFPAEREMLRREAEAKAAEEARHRQWEASHADDHQKFLSSGATTTLTQDVDTSREQLIEQRMALLAAATKATAPDPFAAYQAPPPMFGPFATAGDIGFSEKLVIPAALPKSWAKAHAQGVVIRALLDGAQLTEEDTAVGQAAYLEFYRLLIPIAEVADRNAAAQERMSQSLADSFAKSNRVPCPNCHTANPPTMSVFRAPAPDAPPLQKSLTGLARVTSATWRDVMARFDAATRTMDALVLSTVPSNSPAAEGFTFARDLLQRQQELQKDFPDAIRIPAVFYPKDKWVKSQDPGGKDVEIASGIPWYFYLTHTPMPDDRSYPDGFSWTLRDVTSPKRPQVSYEPSDVERYLRKGSLFPSEVPGALFEKLNNELVFPSGMLYWRYPNGTPGQLETTEPWSLSKWLGTIGMSLVALALLLSTAGLATPAVLAGLGIASAALSVGSTLADLDEKSELGILTQEDKNRAILFIAADIASALSAGLGHVARELGAAAELAGRASKLTIIVQRTAAGVGAIDKALGTTVMVTMTADFVDQYETIQHSNLTPEEREKALKELTSSALFTGAIILAPHAVEALGSKPKAGPIRDPLGLGGEVKPAGTITRGQLEPHPGWSRPNPESEFTAWSTKQEKLTPENAARELQIAERSGTHHDTPNNKEYKQEIQIEEHTWREERAEGGGWCRFSTKQCFRRGSLNVGAKGKGERVTASTKQDVARLRAELQSPPALRTDQARLDWADYRFYSERRLRMIEDALNANQTPPAPPRTFGSFQSEHPPGSVVRNEIQGSRFEKRTRGELEDALGPERAEAVLAQPHLSESTQPTTGKGELTRPEQVFGNPDGKTATAISNKSRESMVDATTARVKSQVIRDLEEAVDKYTGVRQVRRTGEQIEVTRIWLLYDADMVPTKHRATIRKTVKEFADVYLETGLRFEVGIL